MFEVPCSLRRSLGDIAVRPLVKSGGGLLRCAALGALVAACSLVGCGGSAVEGVEGAASGGSSTGGGGGGDGRSGGSGGMGSGVGSGGSDRGDGGGGGTEPVEPETLGELVDVAFANGRFVAVGIDTRFEYAPNEQGKTMIITSEDGRHWTRQREGEDGFLWDVAYGGGTWVASGWAIYEAAGLGHEYAQTVLTSPDAVTWTEGAPPPDDAIDELIWTGSEFLMLTSSSAAVHLWSSPDGAAWSPRAGADDLGVLGVGTKGIVAGGASISFSDDSGVSWVSAPLDEPAWVSGLWPEGDGFKGAAYYDCCFGEVPGSEVLYELSSPDGITWEQTEVPDDAIVPRFVAHGDGGVSVGSGFGAELAVRESADDPWTAVDYPLEHSVTGLAFGADVFVAVGASFVVYSEDGVTWTDAEVED